MRRMKIWMMMLMVAAIAVAIRTNQRWVAFAREAEEHEAWAAGYDRMASGAEREARRLRAEAVAWEADLRKPVYQESYGKRLFLVNDDYRRGEAESCRVQAEAKDREQKRFQPMWKEEESRAWRARRRW